jgi:hypothetical protein
LAIVGCLIGVRHVCSLIQSLDKDSDFLFNLTFMIEAIGSTHFSHAEIARAIVEV